jgi:nitrate reductase (NAD(P)H)
MDALMASGFITPPSLHYVRNHGAVPKLTWSTHTLTINGLVDSPITLTMDELIALPAVTLPITLVCAGNRRKEENMHKKSIGFNWGPCAVSTSHWTGVRLSTLLKLAGLRAGGEGRYVSFRGPTGELPKGADGSYGDGFVCFLGGGGSCMLCSVQHVLQQPMASPTASMLVSGA